jgi:hypothetical protein
MSERDYDRNLHTLAERAFAEHELVRCDHDDPVKARRWEIAKRAEKGWQPFYYTEVVCLAGGRLFVHGDIAPVFYAACDVSSGIDVPRWIAGADFDYTVRKAECGHTGKAHAIVPEVALRDLSDRASILREDRNRDGAGRFAKPPTHIQSRIDLYAEARAMIRKDASVDGAFRFLYDRGMDPEEFSTSGKVADPKLHYAYAALRRLCALVPKVPT